MTGFDPQFLIMDGRARFDQDRACVISCCETLAEAKQEMHEDYLGYDYVVVHCGMIVFDPSVKEKKHGRH